MFFFFQLESLKDQLLERKSDELVALEPNVDVDGFNEYCKQIDQELRLLQGPAPNNKVLDIVESNGSGIYFHRVTTALRLLNEMVYSLGKSRKIGVELRTADDKINIFPETNINPQYVKFLTSISLAFRKLTKNGLIWFVSIPFSQQYQRFPTSALCQSETGLRFINRADQNSDILDVSSNRYCTLFRLAVSLVVPTSLIILNNSIIGMPPDELQKIINWLQHHGEPITQQVILVQRSTTNPLQTNDFHMIHCSSEHGIVCGE